MRSTRWKSVLMGGVAIAAGITAPVGAGLPVAGVPVPDLEIFDNVMHAYMPFHGINAGVLAVSKDGVVVYQRGFGTGIPENTPMRLASVEKPITAAAVRKLIAAGVLNWSDPVFDLDECPGGLLSHVPWDGLADERLCDITLQDLVNHVGGWDRDTAAIGDPQFYTLQMAQEMGIAPPAGRDDIIRYMLSQPLQFDPGTNGCTDGNGNPFYCYSNFGYMVLGRIVEEYSGAGLVGFVHANVLTPQMWVPNQEVMFGRTFDANQSPREPTYQCTSCNCTNVFDPDGSGVPCPYGNWHQEAFLGHGNLVASAAPLLVYMDQYQVAVQMAAGTPLPPGDFGGGVFNGALQGTSTTMWQRDDGINIAVLFTHWGGTEHGQAVAGLISDIIDTQNFDWPTMAVDGFWIDFNASPGGVEVGGYHHPLRTMAQGLAVGAGAKLRFKPGATSWTGTISHRVQMDAPFGNVTIGQ